METEEKKIYTIEDIAREIGVSKTTVSRAISGKGRISQATRDRVRAFIKEHDYRPNVVAKGLAQRKTYNIALLMPKDYVATEFLFFKVYRTSIQSMQNGKAPFAACMIELVMRIAATVGLSGIIGYTSVCIASPMAWIGACALLIPVYYKMMKGNCAALLRTE